jgi:hypothetical protein
VCLGRALLLHPRVGSLLRFDTETGFMDAVFSFWLGFFIKEAVNDPCSIIDEVGLNIFTQKKFNYIGFVLDHVTSSTNRMDAIPARMNGVASSSPQQLMGTH